MSRPRAGLLIALCVLSCLFTVQAGIAHCPSSEGCNSHSGAGHCECADGEVCDPTAKGGKGDCVECLLDSDCDDGDACTTDTCNGNGTCSNVEMDCADGVDCTDDSCVGGNCINTPNDANCTDQICDAALDCVDCTDASDCDDSDPCTTDTCESNSCVNTPLDCSDGVDCTDDSCVGGDCVNTPNDGNCTDQFCDAQFDCVDCTEDEDCSDGDQCTDDSCQAGSCTFSPKDCSDGVDCTDDTCNANDGSCTSTANDNNCAEGFFCSSIDDCSECLNDSQCDDGVACTVDTCEFNLDFLPVIDSGGTCSNLPDDDSCEPGETCDPVLGCVACSSDADCDDGVDCTVDTCSQNACSNTPSDALCDDGVGCTNDSCDAIEDCSNIPDSDNCDPGQTCDSEFGCQDPDCEFDSDCDDGADCSDDICVDGTCEYSNDCFSGAECDRVADECRETACNDEEDNDDDQLFDCEDPDCEGCPAGSICDEGECRETVCDDGRDNDGDGEFDCGDPDCDERPCDDGWDCTTAGSCDSEDGVCTVGAPVHARCDDGAFCNGAERCTAGPNALPPGASLPGCSPGEPPCTGGGEDCDERQDACIEVNCTDGIDNDNGGGTDCADILDCPCPEGTLCIHDNGPPHCGEADCGNGIDDDGDNLEDCADPDCFGRHCQDEWECTDDRNATCSPSTRRCEGSAPAHSSCDDQDSCTGLERCSPTHPQADRDGCITGIEAPCEDPDGQTCTDVDGRPVCGEGNCEDGQDNDNDNQVDCQDEDCICPDGTTCRANGGCPETDCSNGLDDDGDGRIDCADSNCRQQPCDDGYSCTVDDRCQNDPSVPNDEGPLGCFGTPSNLLCGDNATCTRDRCRPGAALADPETGCEILPDDTVCNDGASCTSDKCLPGDPGAHESTGCVNDPQHDVCDDGLFCDGQETCDPGHRTREPDLRGCVEGDDPCPTEGSRCSEQFRRCQEEDCRDGNDNDGDGRTDCDDGDCPDASPEICDDEFDNDCDGLVDCADELDCLKDEDADGHRAGPCGGDCDDNNANVHPGRRENCTTLADDDCDGAVNCQDLRDCRVDEDQDGHFAQPCGDDCDDSDFNVHPRAVEVCGNGKDDDCNGATDCEDINCAGVRCDDGVDCTTGDVCQNGTCRGTLDHTRCEDGISCTVDQCRFGEGCSNDPENSLCDDRLFCNGAEECDPDSPFTDSNGCVDGEDPCGADESCDEVTNSCQCDSDPFEDDDACGDARQVTVDGALRSEEHTLCPEDDLDRIKFAVVQGVEYTFFTTGPVDTLGILTGAGCGSELARNNDCTLGDSNFCIQWSASFTGQAVLTVRSGAVAAESKPLAGAEGGSFQGEVLRGAAQAIAKPGADRLGEEPEVQKVGGGYTLFMQASEQGCLPDPWELNNDGTCAGATPITPTSTPATEDHTLCPAGDIDAWRFHAEAGATYRFSSLGGTDTKVQIRTDDCLTILQKVDDCLGDPNFCIEFTPVSTGFYKVGVFGQNTAVTGPYQFRYEKLGGGAGCTPDSAEPDNACAEARSLPVNGSEQRVSRTICEEGDVDTFRFSADAGKIYRFETAGDLDTRVFLGPDNCGGVLADSTSCGPDAVNACILWEAPASGSYKVRVQGRLPAVTGEYDLLFAQEACPLDGWEPDGTINSCAGATPLIVDNVLRKQSHTICPAGEIDWWTFFAQAGVTYHFFSEGPTDMGGAVLTGDCKNFLVKDEATGTDENFDIHFTPTASGIYSFAVTGDGGPYDLFYQAVSDPGSACSEDAAEDDDACTQAETIVPSFNTQVAARSLCPTDDRDHFQFEAVQGVTYRFWTEGQIDTVGTVRGGPSCTQLKRNDDCNLPNDLNFCMDWTAPQDGTAFVRVQGFNPSTFGGYTFLYRIVP